MVVGPATVLESHIDSTRVSLEEHTTEDVGDRCEVCGAKLTSTEIQGALESGGPAMCSIHADELVPLGEDEEGFEG